MHEGQNSGRRWLLATGLLLRFRSAGARPSNCPRFRGPTAPASPNDKDIPVQWDDKNILLEGTKSPRRRQFLAPSLRAITSSSICQPGRQGAVASLPGCDRRQDPLSRSRTLPGSPARTARQEHTRRIHAGYRRRAHLHGLLGRERPDADRIRLQGQPDLEPGPGRVQEVSTARAASPIVYRDRVILCGRSGRQIPCRWASMRKTGKVVWEAPRKALPLPVMPRPSCWKNPTARPRRLSPAPPAPPPTTPRPGQ